jgi:mono/diheme cytochrome c family protein
LSFVETKTILAVVLLAAGSGAALSRLRLMGKPGTPTHPMALSRIHKIAGWSFAVVALVLGTLGFVRWTSLGDAAPLRAVVHAFLALALIAILVLKISIVKVFRQFLRIAPGLGMSLFVGTLVIFLGSAGTRLLRMAQEGRLRPVVSASDPTTPGDQARGKTIFESRCAECHFAEKEDRLTGPGLKGLFRKPTLPATGRPATVDNILRQLKTPYVAMPAFPTLAGQDLADLMAYLKTL